MRGVGSTNPSWTRVSRTASDVSRSRAAFRGRTGPRLQLADARSAEGSASMARRTAPTQLAGAAPVARRAPPLFRALRRGGFGTGRWRASGHPGSAVGSAMQRTGVEERVGEGARSHAAGPARGKLFFHGGVTDLVRLPAERRPGRDPGDVDVLRRNGRSSECEHPQRSGGVSADAGECAQPASLVGPALAATTVWPFRAAPRAARVPETLPLAQYRCERGRRTCLRSRPAGEERLPPPRARVPPASAAASPR